MPFCNSTVALFWGQMVSKSKLHFCNSTVDRDLTDCWGTQCRIASQISVNVICCYNFLLNVITIMNTLPAKYFDQVEQCPS